MFVAARFQRRSDRVSGESAIKLDAQLGRPRPGQAALGLMLIWVWWRLGRVQMANASLDQKKVKPNL